MRYALRHIPTGRVCDVEGMHCYGTYSSLESAKAWLDASIETRYLANYEVIELPEGYTYDQA